jgi:hypothetical protein
MYIYGKHKYYNNKPAKDDLKVSGVYARIFRILNADSSVERWEETDDVRKCMEF